MLQQLKMREKNTDTALASTELRIVIPVLLLMVLLTVDLSFPTLAL